MPVFLDTASDSAGAVTPDRSTRPAETGRPPAARSATETDSSAATVLASSLAEPDTRVISGGRTIEFSFEESINRVVVRVKSTETGEVVRQIPPEEYLHFLARFKEMVGVILDETA